MEKPNQRNPARYVFFGINHFLKSRLECTVDNPIVLKEIYYLSYFDAPGGDRKYHVVTSGANKSSYILETISELGYAARVIAAGYCEDKKNRIVFPHTRRISGSQSIHYPFSLSLGTKNFAIRINHFVALVSVFFHLLLLHESDTLVVYHSLAYDKYVLWAKLIKGFKLILELEEIYSDVSGNDKTRKREMQIIKHADGFIFSTDLLEERYNTQRKPFVVCNGIYRVEDPVAERYSDGKTHVVYAGTFDPRKGGAAAAAAEYLPSNYHVHICGFGSDQEVEQIKAAIQESNKKSGATISYDGMITGKDFISFLQKCHIGVSTQDPNAVFNSTSFPSKILTYLSNGLTVVSIKIPAIERSGVGKSIVFYEEQSPECIATAIIQAAKNQDNRGREVLHCLHKKFKGELLTLLGHVK